MSKPTSYNVSPQAFYNVFGFYPCSCHESISTASSAYYRVEYETFSYSTELKKIEVTCNCCGKSTKKDVSSMGIDGAYIGF